MPATKKTTPLTETRPRPVSLERQFYETAGQMLVLLEGVRELAYTLEDLGAQVKGSAASDWRDIEEAVTTAPFVLSSILDMVQNNVPVVLMDYFTPYQRVGISEEQWQHLRSWLRQRMGKSEPML